MWEKRPLYYLSISNLKQYPLPKLRTLTDNFQKLYYVGVILLKQFSCLLFPRDTNIHKHICIYF